METFAFTTEEKEQALALYHSVDVQSDFGESVARILRGLGRIQQLYKKNPVIETENFRNLLLSFAEDIKPRDGSLIRSQRTDQGIAPSSYTNLK